MKKYLVVFYNYVTDEVFWIFELEREHITRKDWKNIILALLSKGSTCYANHLLEANIYVKTPFLNKITSVTCTTASDDEDIEVKIYVNYTCIRIMKRSNKGYWF